MHGTGSGRWTAAPGSPQGGQILETPHRVVDLGDIEGLREESTGSRPDEPGLVSRCRIVCQHDDGRVR